MRLRRAACLAAIATMAAVVPPAYASSRSAPVPCADHKSSAFALDLTVKGHKAHGLVAYPDSRPTGLVVFAHGYGHTVESWRKHLVDVAHADGVVAVAMNYYGERISPAAKGESRPSSRGWQVAEGAQDLNAAAQYLDRRCHGFPLIAMYGISMGGNSSGLAVAAHAKRANGKPLYDYWFDIEGAANVVETYFEARSLAGSGNAFAKNAQADIEREMGGPFESRQSAYADHTVVAHAADIASSGIRGVLMVHGVADGLVPYNQSRELESALRGLRTPVRFITVTTKDGSSEPGTTIDGYVPVSHESPFAGHASEASDTATVGNIGFRALADFFSGKLASGDCEAVYAGTSGGSIQASC